MSRPADPVALSRWRADTPGCERVVHLNNAGASLTPTPVRRAIAEHLALESEIGGYEAADARADALGGAYAALGRLLGAAPRNLAMQQNSTVAFAQAFAAFDLGPGDALVLYTDGVTDERGDEDEFGETRLHEVLSELTGTGAQRIADGVVEAVVGFRSGQPKDDVAILAIKVV